MPRKGHNSHFIYKTTCLLNENYYVGMHSTSNLEDGYLGSGKRLTYSIKKHGKENFKREILEYVKSREELKKREIELVNKELLNDPKCINLKEGGEGGFINEDHRKKCTIAGLKSQWNSLTYINNHKIKFAENVKLWREQGKLNNFGNNGFLGKHHTNEVKISIGEKNKIHQLGSGNSQYGKCWITNEKESKSIYKGDLIPDGWRLGRKIKT